MEGDVVRQGRVGAAVVVVVGCAAHGVGLPAWDQGALHVTGAPPLDRAIAQTLVPLDDLVASRVQDVSAAGVLALRDGDAVMVGAPGADPVARTTGVDVVWAALEPDGDVVYTADRDGDEDARLYRRGAMVRDARVADPILEHGQLVWAEPDATTTALWILDVTAPSSAPRRVLVGDGAWTPLDVTRDGTQLLARRSAVIYRIDVATGAAVAVTAPDEATTAARSGARGALFAIAGGHAWEVAPGRRRELAPELAWEVTELAVSPDGGTVAFVTDDDGASVLHLYDVATRTHRVAPGVPTGGVITDLHYGDVLALSFTDARHPQGAFTYDVAAARLVAWTDASVPSSPALVEPEHARVASFDGTPIEMVIYRPRVVREVVVELHGGPEDQWRPRWQPFEQQLASRGIAVIQPNVRGSTGYGAAFAALDDGPRRGDVVRDVGAVLDWLARQPELAAAPVAVMGQSYGGYLALASLVAYPGRLRAGIAVVGIVDFVAFLDGTRADRRASRRAEYGDERRPEIRAELAKLSPLAGAAKIRAPLLIAAGRRDPRVPAAAADRFVAAVRAAGGTVWYAVADDEGHGFVKTANHEALETLVIQLLALSSAR